MCHLKAPAAQLLGSVRLRPLDCRCRKRVIVLDRDGTVIVDKGYLADPEGLELLAGAAAGLRLLYQRGHRLVIITNQSGVGRGFLGVQQLEQIHRRLVALVAQNGVQIEGIYFCPHQPEENCWCRKPQSALILRAAADLGFEPSEAMVVGDKVSDIEFGRSVGAKTILIVPETGSGVPSPGNADYLATDLISVAQIVETLG